MPILEKNMVYDERHGGPFDRGSADAYYGRRWEPHYFMGATGMSERVTMAGMTAAEVGAYDAGFRRQLATGDRKDWGFRREDLEPVEELEGEE